MANRTYRPCRSRDPERERAVAQAETIIAQGRQAARERLGQSRDSIRPLSSAVRAEDEAMNRYIHPIPRAGTGADPSPVYLERVLEALNCQNQLLTDLLGAVNSLTAAVLGSACRS